MSKYLFTVSVLMGVVLLLVVVVFVSVQVLVVSKPLPPTPATTTTQEASVSGDVGEHTVLGSTTTTKGERASATKEAPEGAIPLSSLPLSETQRSALGAVGIDVATFVITPEMITCAKLKLGEARFNEIVDGATPTMMETMSLVTCL